MNARLLRSCAAMWALGLLGMWVARALLALEPGALPVRVAASLWIVGGLGYTSLGVLALVTSGRAKVVPARRALVTLASRR